MDSAAALFQEIGSAGLLESNSWRIRQNDSLDRRTSHIYQCRSLGDLQRHAENRSLSVEEVAYANHRWRNFKRHEAWLALIIELVPGAHLTEQKFHKHEDFFILVNGENVPFDLKVTRFPHSAPHTLSDSGLAKWLYKNQSQQGRFHLANRFFVVGQPEPALYDLELARTNLSSFASDMSRFRHFIDSPAGGTSRAVILRQHLPVK
jgi:hypothetical protein